MPKVIVFLDGIAIQEVQLTKDRTSLGRRRNNDIIIDNLEVSGEHAAFQMSGNEVFVEDTNSTNGTYVNGKPVRTQMLQNGDFVEIGKYKIHYANEAGASGSQDIATVSGAFMRVMSGAASGRQVTLVKTVTTIGKPGVAVAAITSRVQGFVIAHVQGDKQTLLNGATIGAEPAALKNGDMVDLAGTQMEFVQN